MPSPADSTLPVSLTSICLPYVLICSRRMRLISSARISMAVRSVSPFLLEGGVLQLFAEPLQLRPQAAVPDRGTDLGHDAPENFRVGARLEDQRLARGLGERLAHPLQLLGRHGRRARHRSANPADLRVDQVAIAPGDVRELA